MTRPETVEALARVAMLHDDPPGWMWSESDQMVYACECGDHYVAGAIDVVQEADVLAAADWHRAHLATALLDAIDAGQVPGLVTSEAVDHEATGWAVHAEHVERTSREVLHLRSVIDELKSLLTRACEADAAEECWYDHNGGCQAHGFLADQCPYPLIRQYLDRHEGGGCDE